MASTYSTSLRFELIATGEKSGSWGATANVNLGTLLEQAIGGYTTVAMTDANYALTALNGATDEARSMSLKITGTLTATRNVTCPDSIKKLYLVENATTGGFAITFKTTSGTGISIPNGSKYLLQVDGTNVVQATGSMASQNATAVAITGGSITGITDLAVADGGTGSSTASGARTNLGAAASGANTDITTLYLNNTGLKVKDTNASHGLTIAPGSDLTADRTFTLTTGDAARTLDMSSGGVSVASGGTGEVVASKALANLEGAGILFITTAGGTTILTNASSSNIELDGTLTQTVQLPDVSTLKLGTRYQISNGASNLITINTSTGANALGTTVNSGVIIDIYSASTSDNTATGWRWTVAGSWEGWSGNGGRMLFEYSPQLLQTPTAPTAVVGTNTTQIATTAFVKAEIFPTIAGLTQGDVGSYAMLARNSLPGAAVDWGATVAGSSLRASNGSGSSTGSTPSGTWRQLGYVGTTSGSQGTLWVRIS